MLDSRRFDWDLEVLKFLIKTSSFLRLKIRPWAMNDAQPVDRTEWISAPVWDFNGCHGFNCWQRFNWVAKVAICALKESRMFIEVTWSLLEKTQMELRFGAKSNRFDLWATAKSDGLRFESHSRGRKILNFFWWKGLIAIIIAWWWLEPTLSRPRIKPLNQKNLTRTRAEVALNYLNSFN